MKVRAEGKEYKRQPLKAARGRVLKAAPVKATPAVKRRYDDVEPGTRPDGPVQVSTRLRSFGSLVARFAVPLPADEEDPTNPVRLGAHIFACHNACQIVMVRASAETSQHERRLWSCVLFFWAPAQVMLSPTVVCGLRQHGITARRDHFCSGPPCRAGRHCAYLLEQAHT